MAWETWIIYATAICGLALTPGPNGLLALTHGALYGPSKAIGTVVGGVVGFTCLIALSMFGLSALLHASSDALLILKWLGGAYLVWLGIQLWKAPRLQLTTVDDVAVPQVRTLFRQGLLTAFANPKVLLFYGAFLPQFIDVERSLVSQFWVMALTFAVAEFSVEYLVARLANRIRPWLERGGTWFNRLCGTLFVLVGIAMPIHF